MVHLTLRMYCNWSTDYASNHSSIRLNRLTIQPVFNEVSLLTFSKGTHGFDVTVPKTYLNSVWITFRIFCGKIYLQKYNCPPIIINQIVVP